MPNLDFYAALGDHEPIVRHVFEFCEFPVFEMYSEPDNEIAEVTSLAHLKKHFAFESWVNAPTMNLQLLALAVASGGLPTLRRINLKPDALGNATFRYSCEGRGAYPTLLEETPCDRYLRNSHKNHFSPKGAAGWAEVATSGKQSPSHWNWTEVQNASQRLNSFVRRHSVERVGSCPILPIARELRAKGLTFLALLG